VADLSTKTCKSTLNIQPLIPFSINEHWNIITRSTSELDARKSLT